MTGTPQQQHAHPNAHRIAAPPAEGRSRLDPDTAAYLAALAAAANLASIELDLALATHGLRYSLAPLDHTPPPSTLTPGRAASQHPPAMVYETLLAADAHRAYSMRGLVTYAAQWYLHGALLALNAMLTGKQFTPYTLEGLLASRNNHRPVPDVEATLPHYGAHNRPGIPADVTVMATGHADLDMPVAAAWSALWRVYHAADTLERAAGATGQAPPLEAPPTHDGIDPARMHVDLIRLAHAVTDAAEFGHSAPATA